MPPSLPERAEAERRNLAEIERLNQRGGRTLSIVDLIDAGTIGVEMAAFCRVMVLGGASWLTGAVPGGAGKTTIMAALLGFLPPGEPILSIGRPGMIAEALAGRVPAPATMLAHEIGSGPWHGYIWGQDAADFFSLTRRGLRCVSCLHADDPAQTQDALRSLEVAPADLDRVGLQLYVQVTGPRGRAVRRVSVVHCRLAERMLPAFRWRRGEDDFERLVPRAELVQLLGAEYGHEPQQVEAVWSAGEQILGRLRAQGVRQFADVRRAFFPVAPA